VGAGMILFEDSPLEDVSLLTDYDNSLNVGIKEDEVFNNAHD
jgi:hypothetical protein